MANCKKQQQQKLVTVARPTIVPFSARTLLGRGPNSWRARRQKLARKKVFSSHSACMCVRAVAATEGHPARPPARQTVSGTIALNASLRRAGMVYAARGGFLPVTVPQRRGSAEWLLPFRLPRRFQSTSARCITITRWTFDAIQRRTTHKGDAVSTQVMDPKQTSVRKRANHWRPNSHAGQCLISAALLASYQPTRVTILR